MKKKKVSVHKKIHKRSRISRARENFIFGLEKEFVIIFGGGFLVIVLGLMIFYR